MSLVHGLAEHCERYDRIAECFNRNRIDVVGVDLRGHGLSAGRRGVSRKYTDIAGDVSTLVEETKSQYPELPRFLFGHSLGGGLVLHHGMTAKIDEAISGYLVSAPLIRPYKPVSSLTRGFAKFLRKIHPTGTLPIPVSGHKISTIPAEQDRYNNDPLRHRAVGIGLAVDMIETGEEILAQANRWDKQLRLWHSKADKITSFDASEHFANQASNCDFTAFNEARHETHHDRSRDDVHSLMVDFILSNL